MNFGNIYQDVTGSYRGSFEDLFPRSLRTRKVFDHGGGWAGGKVRLLKKEDPGVGLLVRNGDWNSLLKKTDGKIRMLKKSIALVHDMNRMDGRLRILKKAVEGARI